MHKTGRPTKYKPCFAEALIDFFNQPVLVSVTTTIKGSGWSKKHTRYEALFFPTFQAFAATIGVSDNTLENWAKIKYPTNYWDEGLRAKHKYPDFLCAYTRAHSMQKGLLLEYAIIGKLNCRFAKFFAVNNCGMRSRSFTTKIEFLEQYARA